MKQVTLQPLTQSDISLLVLQQWGRVPALNTNETFIDDLAAMVLEKLPSAAPRPGYVPSLNETMNLGPPTGAAVSPIPRRWVAICHKVHE